MLNKLPCNVLKRMKSFLDVKDLYNVGLTCTTLQEIVFGSKETLEQGILFPIGDESMDDDFIHSLVPYIERHIRVERLRMVKLPLSWTGYFCIFNQFAHCVRRIDIKASNSVLIELTHHLTRFAHRLFGIQTRFGIPIMFSEYVYETQRGQVAFPLFSNLNDTPPTERLQDPPFENLYDLRCSSTDHSQVSRDVAKRLEAIIWFLSQAYPSIPRLLVTEDATGPHLPSSVTHKRLWETKSIIPSHVNKRIRQ